MSEIRPGWQRALLALALSACSLLALSGLVHAQGQEAPRLVGFTNIPKLALPLSEPESAWLKEHRMVGAGIVMNDFVPFDLIGLNNEYEGISADYLDAVAAALGVQVRVETFRTREEARQALAEGRVDILPSVPNWLVAPGATVSAPYVSLRHVEVTSRDRRIERAGAITVGYIDGHVSPEALRKAYPQAHLIPYGGAFLGVAAVSATYELVASGKADVTIGNIDSVNYILRQFYPERLKVAGDVDGAPPVDIAFAVRGDAPELLSIINKTLANIPSEEIRRVRANGMFFNRPGADWAGYVRWLSVFGGALALCLVLFALWNRSLKKQVVRRQAAEAELRNQLDFQRAMLDGMPHAIGVRNTQAQLLYCNSAYERLFDVARQSVIGKTMPDSQFAGENLQSAHAIHERYLRLVADGEAINEDLDLDMGGIRRRVLHWAAPIALRPHGERVAFVTGAIDVTERQQLVEMIEAARAKAESANRAKSNFLATMSHEIRTPMNAVMGVLELLIREGRLVPKDQESAELARSSAHSLLGLIDDILDISKIEAGGLEVVPQPAQLRPIVLEVAKVFQSLARQRGLSIAIEIDAKLAAWHAVDASRFRQIVNNLVSNAIKYTDSGGVTIQLTSQGVRGEFESILLEVSDTGIGIAPMPVMDGYALTSAIRRIEDERDLPHCPVLGCTGHVQAHEWRKALDVGMDECLMKPLSVDALLEALGRHLPDGETPAGVPHAHVPQGQDEGAAFELASLQEFSGGDAKREASFLEALLRINLTDLEELEALVQSAAGREAAFCAHKIKGAARIVRANRVVQDCEALEAACQDGDASDMAQSFAGLQRSMGEFNDALARQLHVYSSLAH